MTDRPGGGEGANVWERLHRRKVVQWGLAYMAGAWGLLQGIGFAADAFGWPAAAKQVALLLLLLLGLPVTLVIAWYHGDRGEQHVSRVELGVITLLFLLGGGLFWHYQHTIMSSAAPAAATRQPAPAVLADDHSIAVLPFVNMSSDREQDYFSDGISEELLNLLTRIPQLRVIARTSSFSFKGKEVDIAEIARRLNVAHVLEGSVRKSGNRVRITAQLVRASDSTHLWSQTYDRTLDDVFAIQDEIAGAVVDQLKIELLGAAPSAKPVDSRVYPLLLQARALTSQGAAESYDKAIALYQQVLAIVPDEARAWSGLGEVYMRQAGSVLRPAIEGRRLARAALERALALDPYDARTHSLFGVLLAATDVAGAAPHFQKALTLDRNQLDVLRDAAGYLGVLGRTDEEIALYVYFVDRDPANPVLHNHLGVAHYYAGHWDQAIASLRTATTLSPGLIGAYYTTGQALLMKGRPAEALAAMRAEPDEPSRLQGIALAEHTLGHAAESDAALDAMLAQHVKDQAAWIAVVYAWRGEVDRAFEWLERAVADQEFLAWITAEPMFEPLHHDPRWLPLLRRLGRTPQQLAAIQFDVPPPR